MNPLALMHRGFVGVATVAEARAFCDLASGAGGPIAPAATAAARMALARQGPGSDSRPMSWLRRRRHSAPGVSPNNSHDGWNEYNGLGWQAVP